MEKQQNSTKKCFVCNMEISKEKTSYNSHINLPVCDKCKGTSAEKKAEKEALESLGDGFICGCI